MAYQGISLGDIVGQASAIKGQQQRSQLSDLALQQGQTQLANEQGIQSTLASNPNATSADFAKYGTQGLQAYGQLNESKLTDLTNHLKEQYIRSGIIASSPDPVAAAQQYAPEFITHYDQVHGPGSFAKLTPDQVKQGALEMNQQSLTGLQDPTKAAQNAFEAAQNHYKQEGPGGEAERSKNTIAGENARTQYVQGQENRRNSASIEAANTRAGFTKDGQLDPKFDSQVQAILDYRAAPFAGISMRSGPGASIMAEVNRRDPTYDASTYPAKAAALKSLTSGKDGKTLDQVNTAVQHLSQLKGLLSALNTGDIGIINQARQAYQKATGNAAPTNAAVVANMAAGEVNKVVTGGPGAEGDRDLSRAATQLTGSPEQQVGAIDNITGLMAGRLNSVKNRFVQAKLGPQFDNMLLPETKAALAAHAGGASSPATDAGTAQVITATGPNGQKLYLRNGQWSPK